MRQTAREQVALRVTHNQRQKLEEISKIAGLEGNLSAAARLLIDQVDLANVRGPVVPIVGNVVGATGDSLAAHQ